MGDALLIRADAGERTGSGHVMRCLALAQAWRRRGGRAALAAAREVPAVSDRLRVEGVEVVRIAADAGGAADAEETVRLAARLEAGWTVVDGYDFGAKFQDALKKTGRRVLFIDDHGHAKRYSADVVLNQNGQAREEWYGDRSPETSLWLGSRYVLMRREFMARHERRTPGAARRLLLTFGGCDPDDATGFALRALRRLSGTGWEVRVAVGAGHPRAKALAAAAESAAYPVRMETNVSDMPGWMAWADMALCAGGTTCWELCQAGVPFLAVVLADNQRPVAKFLSEKGVAVDLGGLSALSEEILLREVSALAEDKDRRAAMSEKGRTLVDGHGAARVAMRMAGDPFWLRPCGPEDERLLWEWANDPGVRASAFSAAPIPWTEHQAWFRRRLADVDGLQLIALDDSDAPAGQARFDVQGADAEMDVSVAPGRRGQGQGAALIRLATTFYFAERPGGAVHAYVKEGNAPSLRAFEKAGFKKEGAVAKSGHRAVHFVRRRDA